MEAGGGGDETWLHSALLGKSIYWQAVVMRKLYEWALVEEGLNNRTHSSHIEHMDPDTLMSSVRMCVLFLCARASCHQPTTWQARSSAVWKWCE